MKNFHASTNISSVQILSSFGCNVIDLTLYNNFKHKNDFLKHRSRYFDYREKFYIEIGGLQVERSGKDGMNISYSSDDATREQLSFDGFDFTQRIQNYARKYSALNPFN